MVPIDPPLLILSELDNDFDLFKFLISTSTDMAENRGFQVNENKFHELQIVEILFRGMTFIISFQDAHFSKERFGLKKLEPVFCKNIGAQSSSIGVSIGEHIANGKHTPAVNRTLLELGKILGQAVNAHSIVWEPAGIIVGFEYFVESTDQYIAGGPFPVLIQIRIDEKADNSIQSTGLGYFSNQEIYVSGTDQYSQSDLVKRLVRIAHDVATNGRIDTNIDTNGIKPGEMISIRPTDDLKILNIALSTQSENQAQ